MDTDVEIAVGARSSTCAHMVPPASSQSAPVGRHGDDDQRVSHRQRQSRHHVALKSSHGYSRDIGGRGSPRPMRA
jgi:hypothetical protein